MYKEDFAKIIADKCYQHRSEPFTLASGQLSNHYINVKKMYQDRFDMWIVVEQILEKFFFVDCKLDAVAGSGLGGWPLVSGLVTYSAFAKSNYEEKHNRYLQGIYVRTASKDHGTKQLVEHSFDFTKGFLPPKVVVVEDVMTTGESALVTAKELVKVGFEVVALVPVVDRREVRSETLEEFKIWPIITLDDILSQRKR